MGDAIVIASDHRGTKLKAALRERLEAAGHDVVDVGTHGDDPVDYPDYAAAVARSVSRGEVPRGIVICGSGLGVSYTANRFPGVRAAWVQDTSISCLPAPAPCAPSNRPIPRSQDACVARRAARRPTSS
jgi:ribose 5-phosphate isomerase B